MISKYPGQNIPPNEPAASAIPRLQWIEVLAQTLKVWTSPQGQNSPVSKDTYYNTTYINTELTAIKNRLSALEGRATNLETRATVVEGRATTLETGLATTNTNLATTNTNLATTNTNLATTNTNVGIIQGIINPPSITSSGSNVTKSVGQSYSYQITASNTPSSYNATGLPPGLNINTSTGLINGTFTTGGTYSVTVYASNLGGTGAKNFTITVN